MTPSTSEPPFTRTKCACTACVACCKRQPGALIRRDFARIIRWYEERQSCTAEVAFAWFKRQFWASPGALVKDVDGVTHRVGTITPRFRKGRCVFLNEKDRCDIHEVAPFGCAYYDTHMVKWHDHSIYAVQSQCDPDYQALRNELPIATHYKPTPS